MRDRAIKKRILMIMTVCILLIPVFSSCSSSPQSVTECGEQVISLMAEMAESEEYLELYTFLDRHDDMISQVRQGNYANPSAIYELIVPDEALLDTVIDKTAFSDGLYRYIHASGYSSFASRFNQDSGVDSVSVSSVLSAQMTFVNESLDEDKIYLYVFDNGYPIAITFTVGEDDSFRAVGNFIINDKLLTDNEDSIEKSCESIGLYGVTAEKQS